MEHSIKEAVIRQLEYCEKIKNDIIEHNGSEAIQKYAQNFAEIESPIVGGTEADWIRIHWGAIYIFIPLEFKNIDNTDNYALGKEIEYNLDFLGEYGGELIIAYSKEEFIKVLEEFPEARIKETYYLDWDTEEEWEDAIPEDYVPFEQHDKNRP